MTYFLNGEIYRESCYKCTYAKPERCADITTGDFWGIVGERKDLSKKFDVDLGVSCLLVNTAKGMRLIDEIDIDKYEVKYEEIKKGNEPLNSPSKHTNQRSEILELWRRNLDWSDVDYYWRKNNYKVVYSLWSYIPPKIQHTMRVLLGKK